MDSCAIIRKTNDGVHSMTKGSSGAIEQPDLFDGEIVDRDTQEARAHTPRRAKKKCVFCEIANNQAAAFEVWRDDSFVAFLDKRPLFPGHVLMIPVVHVQTYDQLPLGLATEWVRLSQRTQLAAEKATNADGSLIIVNNVVSQSVPHLHLHLIPRSRKDGLRLWLGPRHPYTSDGEAESMANKIKNFL
jgi:histidine triad (HIT) family protein